MRVFSYWRTVRPEVCFARIWEELAALADAAAREGLTIGLENEHACNIATGGELARALTAVDHPNLKAVWDPANALVAGDIPYPVGYSGLVAERIGHIHAKDCRIVDGRPVWGPLGQCGNGWREQMEATLAGRAGNSRNRGGVDWRGQMVALWRDGYRGWISLETHWEGPGGDRLQGSAICARNLRKLVEEAGEGYPIDRGLRR